MLYVKRSQDIIECPIVIGLYNRIKNITIRPTMLPYFLQVRFTHCQRCLDCFQ